MRSGRARLSSTARSRSPSRRCGSATVRNHLLMAEKFDVVDLIRTKRDKGTLTTAEINWLIDAYTRGYVGDEQMAAFAMAVTLNGMTRDEVRDLTLAMIASGERMDFS